jgi:hypothetical protein
MKPSFVPEKHARSHKPRPRSQIGALRRLVVVGVGVVVLCAGCGGSTKAYSAAATQACLSKAGAAIGGKLDFVASSAVGGAFIVHLHDGNFATIAFGKTNVDGTELQLAYQQFAFPNVKQTITSVLRRYDNAILLWHETPTGSDLSLIANCLK